MPDGSFMGSQHCTYLDPITLFLPRGLGKSYKVGWRSFHSVVSGSQRHNFCNNAYILDEVPRSCEMVTHVQVVY